MDLTLLLQIVGILGTILSMGLLLKGYRELRNTKDEVFDYFEGFVAKAYDFYAAEKKDIFTNGPKMIVDMFQKPILSQMGKASGVSRTLKGAENFLIEQGIGAATGNPAIGQMASGLLKKYPTLKAFLPMLMQGRARALPRPSQGGVAGYG